MNSIKDKTTMLIGGAGYIGSATADRFIKNGHKLKIFDNLIYKQKHIFKRYENENLVELINGDIRNSKLLSDSLENVDNVVMFAGLVGDPITKIYPELSQSINTEAIENSFLIINNSAVDRFIFISTCSNYGLINNNELANEEYSLNPLSLYAKSKVSCEKKLLSLKNNLNFTPTILRFATAFGLSPRMRFDLTVNEFTYHLSQKKELVVYDKDTWRPYCHVFDFAYLIEKVLSAEKNDVAFEVFNAGHSENNATKQMLVELIGKHIENIKVVYKGDGFDRRNYKVDFSKVKQILDFTPKYSIEKGIIEILNEIDKGKFSDFEKNKINYGNYEI
tara:strand:- start:1055 stop:2056 length:1002 start_codon:yes stop_codon:yes gene_type:complete